MENENGKNGNEIGSSLQFFLYLTTFISLAYVAFGVGNILFEFVNKLFPDLVNFDYGSTFNQGSVKFAISSIFVAGPIFFILSWKINQFIFEKRMSLESMIRKWLTHVVLFFSAGTVIGDLVVLMNNFLNGDLQTRFLLKVLIVLLIAGSIFGYYLWDIRQKELLPANSPIRKAFFVTTLIVVTVVFVFGFFIIDSPKVSREKRIDLQVVSELQNADNAIRSYFTSGDILPEKISDLDKTNFAFHPQKGSTFEYRKTGDTTFVLCANFVRSNENDSEENAEMPFNKEWKHGQGKVCFDRVALKNNDPKLTN